MIDRNELNKRFQEAFNLLKSKGLIHTQKDLADAIGKSETDVSSGLKGRGKLPSLKMLLRVADAFPNVINKKYMETGEGSVGLPEISYSDGVPYFDVDFLLGFDEIANPDNQNPEYLIRMPGYEKATMWCNASGHSMEPEINSGDIIALQLIEDFSFLPFGDVYGFVTTNGMRTIKRLGRSEKEGYYRLIPTNREYDEQEIPIRMIACVYRVMGAMKAF